MKKLVAVTLAVLAGLLIAGCSKGGDKPAKEKAKSADLESVDPTGQKVTFWYQHTRQREEELKAMIADFNKTNAQKIEVAGEYAGDYGDICNKMMAGIQSDELPNLVVAYQNQAAGYAHADALVDLNPYIDSKKWGLTDAEKADFFPAFWKQDVFPSFGGKRLGFPPNRSMEVLYYNEEWLRELGADSPPATWEAFAALCAKAAKQPFSRSAGERSFGYIHSVDASRFAAMVFSNGGDVANADRSAYTLNTPQAKAAMTLLQQLCKSKAAEAESEPDMDQAEFAAGRALFNIGSSSGLPFYKSAVQAGVKFRWAVAALPHTTPQPVQDIYGASVSIPTTTPAAQLATWLFVKWLTEPKQQARWAKASNYFPTRKSTADALKDYFAANPNYAKLFALLEYGKAEPAIAGYDEVRDEIEKATASVLDGDDVGKALEDLQKKAEELLEEAAG
ncbi:MAG: ABC transporter substrate-binding protein [Armatimonadetes bacterium]|nr:ABC transporter substrate-binding protein [Armatimonadota bacterium]